VTIDRFLRILRLRWRSLTQPLGVDRDLDRELEFHFAQLVREQMEAGLDPTTARRAARRAMGNVAAAKDYARDHRRLSWIHQLREDVAYAARGLRRRPAFTIAAVFALTLGIALAAAVAALIDVNLVRPIALPRADRLVIVRTQSQVDGREHDQSSLTEFLAWKSRARSLESVEASFGGDRDISADGEGRPAMRVATRAVTPGWFAVLGARPALGRVFTPEDYARTDGPDVIVLSDALWTSRFGRNSTILGRIIRVNRSDVRVIGVMPAAFPYQPGYVQAWFPLRLDPASTRGIIRWFNVIALRRPDVSLADVQADVERVSATLIDRLPPQLDWRPRVVGLKDAELGWAAQPLWAEAIVALLVLLVAYANVTGLLVARNATRTHEFAIRLAVGATPARLVQQVSAEALLLATLAGVPAAALAVPVFQVCAAIVMPPIGSSRLQTDHVVPIMLAVVVALVLCVGIAIGVTSALASVGRALMMTPRVPSRSRDMRTGLGGRGLLGVAQVAASVILLTSSMLVVETYVQIAHRDLHFDAGRLLLFHVRVPGPEPLGTLQTIANTFRGLEGVESVAGVSDWWRTTLVLPKTKIYLDDRTSPTDVEPVSLVVTPGVFSVMRLPMLAGREFTDADTTTTPWAVVVNQETARRVWRDENPIGRTIELNDGSVREVIGVVANTPLHSADVTLTPVVYTSYFQQPPYTVPAIGVGPAGRMTVIVRYRANRDAIARDAPQRAASVVPDVPVIYAGAAAAVGPPLQRLGGHGLVLASLGLMTLAFAAISVYGLTAAALTKRVRELAIRTALGAGRWRRVAIGARVPVAVVLAGLIVGVVGTRLLSKQIASELWWGVRANEPVTTFLVLVFTAGVGLAVAWLPLRRALRRSPAEILRVE
jgi:predicted permease